ncbi:MAG TPA: 2'-5' RNA ligase family protein [Mucilaginibacter sp.]|jgi:2'-5' RNA ligase|nr:2'-5' RNA ligase family protein [Mucilaginibacter sp.]
MNYKDFLLIISPPDAVNYQVARFKKACAKHIGPFDAQHSKAHISFGLYGEEIQTPRQKTFVMERFIDLVAEDINIMEPVELTINGFNVFSHGKKSKTIYAVIEVTEKTTAWFNKIKEILRIEGNITPHITVAKSLSIDNFNKLWPHFENLEFKHVFTPGCITVLTREIAEKPGYYSLYKEIPFARRQSHSMVEPS